MLCSKFKQIAIHKSTLHNKVQIRYLITSRDIVKKWVWIDGLLASVTKSEKAIMSPIRIIIKDLRVWSIWTRRNIVSTVIRRCSRDRGVREVIQCFRQAFLRPKRTLLISATAAYKARDDGDDTTSCEKSITDAELQELLEDMDAVEMLSRRTLFCSNCGMRLVIDKKQPGVRYCSCKPTAVSDKSEKPQSAEGWVPYMEAEDVIIWRKEYKPGLGLYAYKVYGRYSDVRAADFAAVQVDCTYRRVWDAAVAALAVVESSANGLPDQAVLHWEVLWPRLFANRDYVYIRRHKQFDVTGQSLPHRAGLFQPAPPAPQAAAPVYIERPSVHSNAKRKAMEMYENELDGGSSENKAYVILNRSCEHPKVPETKHAIRVSEYWSHMVVKTMNGPDKSGMEFVLTYYDEPAVGGMPSSVASWATGRAAPAYLQRMRRAAAEYRAWARAARQEVPDFTPLGTQDKPCQSQEVIIVSQDHEVPTVAQHKEETLPVKEQEETKEVKPAEVVQDTEVTQPSSEEDKEEFKIFGYEETSLKPVETRDQATQTEDADDGPHRRRASPRGTQDKGISTEREVTHEPVQTEGDSPKPAEEEEPKNGGWWRYIYPFYYFV